MSIKFLNFVRSSTCSTRTTNLCYDDIAVGSILIGYHVVEDELRYLGRLAAPRVALDDDHLVLLDG